MKRSLLIKSIVLVLIMLFNTFLTTPFDAQAQSGTDDMSFVADVTIPDGYAAKPGEKMNKTWIVKNSGSKDWKTDYTFNWKGGPTGDPVSQKMISNIGVNNTVSITVTITAPTAPGQYRSYWRMKNSQGVEFGATVYASFTVSSATNSVSDSQIKVVQVSSGEVQFTFNNTTYRATPSPNNKYIIENSPLGSITVLKYRDCYVDATNKYVCVDKYRAVQDLGFKPFIELSEKGDAFFHSYLPGLKFDNVAQMGVGTLVGTNGFKLTRIAKVTSTLAEIQSVLSLFALPVLSAGYVTWASELYVVTYTISPQPVPVAPAVIDQKTAFAVATAAASYLTYPEAKRYAVSYEYTKNKRSSGTLTDPITGVSVTWFITIINGMCTGYLDSTHRLDSDLMHTHQDLNNNKPGEAFNCGDLNIVGMFLLWGSKAMQSGLTKAGLYFVFQRVLDILIPQLEMSIPHGFIWNLLKSFGVVYLEDKKYLI